MADFGHIHTSSGDAHMDQWGAGPFKIEFAGRSYIFEDSDRFGPVPVKANGWEVKSPGYFGEKSPFWYAWRKWRDQGRRVDADGKTCIWGHENVPW